ncbi:MAG: class I SAM-dependent methyltransferase [Candidatus Omnitrophota bacterium]|nr:MAG: class I SAM-dependent methyltransferase [Candidatus Omnitrophota bacterium]
MKKLTFYLFRLYLLFISLIKLLFFFIHLSAIKCFVHKLSVLLLDYYKDTETNLSSFTQSKFYQDRESKLCWAKTSVLSSCWGNLHAQEISFLSTIVSEVSARTIFEFGTYNGYANVHHSKKTSPQSTIYTIDLPREDTAQDMKRLSLIQAHDDMRTVKVARDLGVGTLFAQRQEYPNIIQLFGDTLMYDFSPWFGKIDLCFIDAAHSYQYVKSDSENAFKMLSERGVLVWHDFDVNHYDVFRYLNTLAKNKKLFWIENTRLVVYFSSDS